MNLVRRNAQILLATEFLTRGLLFLVVVQLANQLGDVRYGQLAYVFAIANLGVVLADFGLHAYVTRLVAQSSQAWLQQRRSIICLKIIGSSLAWLLTIGIVSFTQPLTFSVIAVGSLAIIFSNGRMFSEAIARGQQTMQLEGYSKLFHAAIQAAALWLVLQWTDDLFTIALMYGSTAGVAWLVSLWLVRRPLQQPWPGAKLTLKPVLFAVTPFAISLAINAQFNYFDAAVLGWWYPSAVVGWYSAAYKPIFFLTALIGLIISAFFPQLVTLWQHKELTRLRSHIKRLIVITAASTVGLALLGSIWGDALITLLYRPAYQPAITPFIILLWSTVCISIWAPLGNSLQACGFEKVYTKNFILAAIINVPLTIGLVWQYSLIGAAVATMITNFSLVILMAKDAQKYLWHASA